MRFAQMEKEGQEMCEGKGVVVDTLDVFSTWSRSVDGGQKGTGKRISAVPLPGKRIWGGGGGVF